MFSFVMMTGYKSALCSLSNEGELFQYNVLFAGLPELEIVNCWLSDLRFEEYFSLFASAGYDMPTISRM